MVDGFIKLVIPLGLFLPLAPKLTVLLMFIRMEVLPFSMKGVFYI
jgi:hypothetical protein